MRRADLAGQKFGSLLALKWEASARSSGAWICKCDCGNETTATSNHLTTGRMKSCGCQRPARHGGKGTRAYGIWQGMIGRCSRPAHKNWARYGGRGIAVCERWLSFAAFREDMGEPAPGATLERVDNNGNYEPGNCRWATRKEQSRNTRRSIIVAYSGKSQSLAAWADEFGVSYWKLHSRHKLGWSPERMFGDVVR